ncbi:MAG: hypothetical protein EOO14_15225 [Chitinophagaceae bacterium]|nr:MAG: hypothetical protein EOO14_15225 [Chitinophagaceae bacterium]
MAGRGDNNKNGTSGRGASNQSMQGMKGGKQEKASHGKQTGGQPSVPQKESRDQEANRNTSVQPEND